MKICSASPGRASLCGPGPRRDASCTGAARTTPSTTRSECATSMPNARAAWAARRPIRWRSKALPRNDLGPDAMTMNGRAETEAVKASVRDVIYRACLRLDAEDFTGWLKLCAPDFNYRIKTYSPEIRKEMTWYEQDAAGLAQMIEMLPRHNTDHGRLTRHATVYSVDIA